MALTPAPQSGQQAFAGLMAAVTTHTPAIIWVARTATAIHRRIETRFSQIIARILITPQRAVRYI
jgi:hypothetical protein